MDPPQQWCHNGDCPARGQAGPGNLHGHSQKARRSRCKTCGRTFAATTGTPCYRLRPAADWVTLVLVLLCHGCPRQAIVAAFGLDERTVGHWQACAGRHCQQVHEAVIEQGRVALSPVQADALGVQRVGKRVWMAMALAVPARRWWGGVIRQHRDRRLSTDLVRRIQACAKSFALLVCVDGLARSVTAFLRVFRYAVRTGRRGRPRLEVEPGLLLGPGVKRDAKRRVVGVVHRVVRGTAQALSAVLSQTHTGLVINTAYSERRNATFRSALAPLGRRGRAIAH